MNPRTIGTGVGSGALAASLMLCAAVAIAQPATDAAAPPAAPPAPPQSAELVRCIATLRAERALFDGVRLDTFDAATRSAADLRSRIDQMAQSQPEFKLAIWDYLSRRVDDERVADGQAVLSQQRQALAAIEQRHGVDAATVVAVFGIETDYGRVRGRWPVVDTTLSRACLRPDNTERKRHFFAALWILQEGLVQPGQFDGSWAGAFGMTQFMPGTFRQYMDDGDGSGSVDIMASVPDALGTTARYLKGLNWSSGRPWGIEVKAPAAVLHRHGVQENGNACLAGADSGGSCKPVFDWQALGVTRIDGRPLADDTTLVDGTRTALLVPAGPDGPAWLVTRNYRAIWQYNRADAYALAIGLLSDRLRGDPPMRGAWPTDDPGLSRAEMRELQALLRERGHCGVTVDGSDGPITSAAVASVEHDLGWSETGRAGSKVLRAVRGLPVPAMQDGCAPAGR